MKNQRDSNQRAVFYVDPVGGHRGMHYYDFELCPALREIGFDITLLTCDETQNLASPPLLRIEYPFRDIYGSSSKILRGWRYLRGLVRIGLAMEQRHVSLIHLHYTHFAPLDYLFARWLNFRGKGVIFTAHDVIPFDARSSDLSWFRRLYNTVDSIIVHANTNRETLLDIYHVDPGKVYVVPMGPYLTFAQEQIMPTKQAREHLGLKPTSPVILFFGQIKKVKGLSFLLRAFRQIADQYPDARLVIAGPEWKDSFDNYAALISELGVADQIISRIEYVPDDEVGCYFSSADMVVLPYIDAYQSAVLYMAYSFKKPVIASAVGGLIEVVQDDVTGLLVPPADVDALAQAIMTLLHNPEQARIMGEQGRLLVENEFGWQEIAKKTAEVYATVPLFP